MMIMIMIHDGFYITSFFVDDMECVNFSKFFHYSLIFFGDMSIVGKEFSIYSNFNF